jgi:molybdenum cofactor guanylyltransferase
MGWMTTSKNTTGLILAGGAGLRMGGIDKGLVVWRGEPLAAHVARRLRPQVKRLIFSCNRNADFYAALADATVSDKRQDFQGPLAGIEAAIPMLAGEFLVVTPCDTPLLPHDLVRRLITALDAGGDDRPDISYVHDGKREQYLCAAIRTSILPSLSGFLDEGHRTVRHWYAAHRSIAVDFSRQADCFANHNWPDSAKAQL